jgi:hypothetical protein
MIFAADVWTLNHVEVFAKQPFRHDQRELSVERGGNNARGRAMWHDSGADKDVCVKDDAWCLVRELPEEPGQYQP